ncbi:hypothetical protein C9374_000935 [Naegleria lovaniensis]|uniref:Structural maintenance of chromosomes protein 5 n=1 Tax=Naegleria lovaniensis TaxID=51637 RepID=A0AA88GSI5_NAELO|nr:uncharacterized protein C9374_000935 [Naegleria lovaniensis]KAG2388085.1 hypothetical protein C9374_000935 [Naegleria lovaniensis]
MPARKKPTTQEKRKRNTEEEEQTVTSLNGETSQKKTKTVAPNQGINGVGAYQIPKMRPGSIYRIKLQNFMTYDDCEFFPGPGLNLVLGPNGTGKSSIVSAICVGLAGSTKLLGRASKVADYIKHGKDKAFIEIELYTNDRRNLTIKRTFVRKDGKESSTWKINNNKKSMEQVKQIIDELNIQLDNLTQFLPQEKVSEFAGLTPTERLKQTQEAVLPPEVIKYQESLIKEQEDFKKNTHTIDSLQSTIDTLKKKNSQTEKEVEKYKQRQEYLKKAELCSIKLPIARFKQMQTRGKTLREEIQKKKQEYEVLQNKNGPLKDEIDQLQQQHQKLENEQKKDKEKINTMKPQFQEITEKIERSTAKVEQFLQEIASAKQKEEHRKNQIQKLDRQIDLARQRITSIDTESAKAISSQKMRELESTNEEMSKITDRRLELGRILDGKKQDIEEVKQKIQKLENAKHQRLKKLGEKYPNVVKTYEWYQSNRRDFNKPVYLVPLEISVLDSHYADYLEMHLPEYLFRSFVCEDFDDRNKLTQYVEQCKYNITIIDRTPDVYAPLRLVPQERLKHYGMLHYLDQTFEAPDVIKMVLKDIARIDTVAVGGANAKIEAFLTETPIKCAFVPGHQYLMRSSMYSANTSTRVIDVTKARLFIAVDLTEKESLNKELQVLVSEKQNVEKELNEVKEKERNYQTTRETLDSQKKEADKRVKEHESLLKQVSNYEKQKRDMLKGAENIEEVESKCNQKIKEEKISQISMHIQLKDCCKKLIDLMIKNDKRPLSTLSIKKDIEEKRILLLEAERRTKELESAIKTLESEFNAIKIALNEIKVEMEERINVYGQKHGLDSQQVRDLLTVFPEGEEELRTEIQLYQEEAEKIVADEASIVEYERRKKEIEEKEIQLQNLKDRVANISNTVNELKEKWLKPLKTCVDKINETFMEYCKHIGISGEVCLTGNDEDFRSWEIDIKVKFRDSEKLCSLSAQRQSGGERSVTTILYLLSLQQLNKAPFRVVDEINQGMDSVNERKIFYQMLDSSQGEDIPQSFLITPKLLPNLVPNNANNITILFIFNGPVNISQDLVAKYFSKFDKSLECKKEPGTGSSSTSNHLANDSDSDDE